jgi:hypothetical protein
MLELYITKKDDNDKNAKCLTTNISVHFLLPLTASMQTNKKCLEDEMSKDQKEN